MEPLHQDFELSEGSVVEVCLNRPANVLLVSETQYDGFIAGHAVVCHGGLARATPCRITVPYSGKWHLLIDREFAGALVCADVSIKA
jgi:hypothetical protein